MRRAVAALALSLMTLGSFAPTAFSYENPNGGQHFDRGRFPRTYHIAENGQKITCPGPKCTPEFVNDAIRRGVMKPEEAKALREILSNPKATRGGGVNSPAERNKSDTTKPNPPTAARSNGGAGN